MKYQQYMKTSEYAKLMGVTQRTIINNFHKGLIPGYQDSKTNTIYIENPHYKTTITSGNRAILYARVSSSDNKKSLDGQMERMKNYAAAKGYTIVDEIKEIYSGLNDHRPRLTAVLKRDDYDILICEHKDRLTRFGFNYLDILLNRCNIRIDVINTAKNKDDDLMNDFVSIVTSFCSRIYGRKRKHKTNEIIEALKHD